MMKRISTYLPAVLLAAVSCSGNLDVNDNTNQAPEDYVEPYVLTVDKTEVEADGKDMVTFSLLDAYDRNILEDKKALQNVNIFTEDGSRVDRMSRTATYFKNGIYTYKATFKGVASGNTVTVEAKNRGKYEKYHKNVALFKCTSVWCSACPGLASSLHALSDDAKDHSVVLACHGNFNYSDPFSLYVGGVDLGSYLMGRLGGSGWPTLIYDLEKSVTGVDSSLEIEANIMKRRSESSATCGIRISSVKVEGNDLKVQASVKTGTGGKYDLACAVLRDGLQYPAEGVYSLNGEGVFDEVVVNLTDNFLRYDPDGGKELKADEEYSREFSFSFGEAVPSESELSSFRVAVYAHRQTEDGSTMDNIVECAYGKSVDYKLN